MGEGGSQQQLEVCYYSWYYIDVWGEGDVNKPQRSAYTTRGRSYRSLQVVSGMSHRPYGRSKAQRMDVHGLLGYSVVIHPTFLSVSSSIPVGRPSFNPLTLTYDLFPPPHACTVAALFTNIHKQLNIPDTNTPVLRLLAKKLSCV